MDIWAVPLRDQIRPLPHLRTRTYFIINAPLDALPLKAALDRLVRHHWRFLGGRLIQQPDARGLECHVPQQFEDGHELFKWTSEQRHNTFDETSPMLKAKHPIDRITFLPAVRALEEDFSPQVWPIVPADEPPDAPIIWVHVCVFADVTVIGLSCNHAITDQGGVANIVRAWMGLVCGQEPPPMTTYENDPLRTDKSFVDYAENEVNKKGRLRWKPWWEFIWVLLGLILELVMRPKESRQVLFFPLDLVEKVRTRCNEELESKEGVDPRLSHGDVLSAILFKFSRAYDRSAHAAILSQTINLRGRHPELPAEKSHSWIHNSQHYATSLFQYSPTSTRVSDIAALNRKAILEALDPADVEIGLVVREEMARRKQGIQFLEAWTTGLHVSNWTSALRDLGVEEAVRKLAGIQTVEVVTFGSGRPIRDPNRFSTYIMSRTTEGYLVDFAISSYGMKALRELLEKDPGLDFL